MKKEDYNKFYIQGSDHYLIPKDVFDELFDEMENWKQDTQKYKEVIDKATNELFILFFTLSLQTYLLSFCVNALLLTTFFFHWFYF